MSEHRDVVEGALRPGSEIRAMFDRIVPRYDLMNRIMTGGRDVAWRRLAVREALRDRVPKATRVLDLATGTGDLAIALRDAGAGEVTGLDFSSQMLAAAARKTADDGTRTSIAWIEGDAMALPFPDESFDVVTIAFGLRNLPNYAEGIREMARVLCTGGTLVCLETTPLTKPMLREVFTWGFANLLPRVAALISGDEDAYSYLPASAAVFPDAVALGRMMQDAGLRDVRFLRLGAGTVALHVARKPQAG
ncbi:MAG: bifunctional demethylmenaquinone methyltransferase/2-methoxy-6-polyprenyl-1,4-benzoquinol methylase UbiE [Thermomicrobiales bacterium]